MLYLFIKEMKFLKCLISINNQLLKPKEVIIVNNNTDLSDSNQLYNVINSINFVQSIKMLLLLILQRIVEQ